MLRESSGDKRGRLRPMLWAVPSLITLSSIFCGFCAIHVVGSAHEPADLRRACLLIVFAMFFDVLDGRVARMTRTQSSFGLQLDSLADIVSFGVAPAVLVYHWSLKHQPVLGFAVAFAFVAAGAIRLARFNVLATAADGKPLKPGKYIKGLPIPGAAGILTSIVVADQAANGGLSRPTYAGVMLAITGLLSLLMVSNVRFRSFKDAKLNRQTILVLVVAVGSSALIATKLQPAFVLVWLLGMYVMVGIGESFVALSVRVRTRGRASTPPTVKP